MKRFEGKTVIITGGAAGIGFTSAKAFSYEGATVVIWDINEDKGHKAVEELSKISPAHFLAVNTANSAAVKEALSKTLELVGKVDVLINNAGITRDATLLKMTDEQWQQVIDVNLTGVFNCGRAVAAHMAERGSGVIINTSSVVALYGNFGQSNYVATKSGLIGMTKVWAKELGRKGIRVNAVAPGFIATEMITTVPEKVINALLERTPLQRLGKPEDIASAYLFLASDEASFITGTCLSVDGGITI
ncbi:beta-ketoacyl-ACP reductase [Thermaurantimonas aggregans]|uniref:3-oxoacyl-[acyl-carrier-protein] reductase FabG n=1 Tax=Thermaurantimonas aggregans TaxID=2173829 RepID=A0A401XLF9_9FLAO|nr:3-oxoacyl-ACP reductase FabG [Thermaurantimonas aggregans]MCX8148323.1 3-oxoacyl-ACP reductase FabG [Thermaurantimonas aggregans]GCD77828.1 beta-ketoacyl-ACP reductase [Thermaurantimonas aggregans]